MNEPFLLPVMYKGDERAFETNLQVLGFIHRLAVDVDGVTVFFERDEEGAFRAIMPPESTDKPPAIDLLRAIAETIDELLA
ncbi:MAG TPA: hypothetical protein VL547_16555 [Dinghuibacter sp.]|uniref:hypothetical protein n=1 Tax=Dinghuibacter sp. TaxID=2024697 RepID=UPI002CB74C40|nr:hypothetical protein [Dinghuibacter sp.]HTJ13650.1 hypothetical protein [Dinghuibacter sp.]